MLERIAEMPEPDRALAERIHALSKANPSDLKPKTCYGMPAYARDGKAVCFFQSEEKSKERCATCGFSDQAKLDQGFMWPTSYALKKLFAADEKNIVALLEKAGG